ncbi:MAG: hypothetical protein KJ718_05630 [Nanoarchaeota archaeon]|nr:hypothetical protein [Nanoarchaeota archaeon]MBU1052003.1 hypothetical protein [Nanoarchaeota archaeon]MBU1988718.1 hypothetical protein [Nanoarchaeota archaeon]
MRTKLKHLLAGIAMLAVTPTSEDRPLAGSDGYQELTIDLEGNFVRRVSRPAGHQITTITEVGDDGRLRVASYLNGKPYNPSTDNQNRA